MNLRKGMRVTCGIAGTKITDAKIQEEDGRFFICQNERGGYSCKDRLGFRYSWGICQGSAKDLKCFDVTDFRIVSTDIENVYEGAIIANADGKCKVLGICGEAVFASLRNNYTKCNYGYTIDELKELDYTIVPETPITKKPDKVEINILINGKPYDGKLSVETLRGFGLVE